MSDELPEGWVVSSLGEICSHPQYGWTTPAKKIGKGLKLLRTTDISAGPVDWSAVPECTEEPEDPTKYLLKRGDILVSRAGSVGVSHIVDGECPRAVFASYLIRFRPLNGIPSEFIGLFLQSRAYWSAINEDTAGIAIPNINASKLSTLELPLPPVAEQHRIVTKVEELFAELNGARNRLTNVAAVLRRFRQAVLAAAYSGHLTATWRDTESVGESAEEFLQEIQKRRKRAWTKRNLDANRRKYPESEDIDSKDLPDAPQSWQWASADAVCSQVTDGEHIQPPYQSQGSPMLSAKHVRDGFVTLEGAGLISQRDFKNALERCEPVNGDILIVSVGATTGRAAIVEKCPPFAIVRSVLLLKPVISSPFLLHWLQSPWCFRWMTQASGASAQPHLYIKDTKRLPVPIPPLAEQEEIVRRVESLFALADDVGKQVAVATACADKVAQSILAKAFRGELVPTEAELAGKEGRDYEPASMLLERIREHGGKEPAESVTRPQRRGRAAR